LGADGFLSQRDSPSAVLAMLEEGCSESRKSRPQTPGFATTVPMASEMKNYSSLLVQHLEENSVALEKTHAEVRTLNEKLEKLVGERTAQLEVANLQL